MLLPNQRFTGVAGVGIIPTAADEIGGECAIVVDVGLAVGDAVNFDDGIEHRHAALGGHARREQARKQRVAPRIVTLRRRESDAVFRHFGEAHAEVIRLHGFIGGAGSQQAARRDLSQQFPLGILGRDIDQELVKGRARADPGQGLTVLRAALPAVGVGYPCLGHQVALVTAVDKDLSGEGCAVFQTDFLNLAAALQDAVLLAQTVVQEDRDAGFLQHLQQNRLADVRFDVPCGFVAVALYAVVAADAEIELEGVAANDLFLAEVGEPETAGNHSTNVGCGF